MPVDGITGIIEGAIADATGDSGDGGDTLIDTGEGGADADAGDTGSGEDHPDAGDTADPDDDAGAEGGDADAGDDDGAAAAAAKKPDPVDPDDARLAEWGLTPKAAGKDNRIPYTQTKRIILNGVKKATAQIQGELTKAQADVAPLKVRASQMDAVDRLIETNPEAFMERLALVNPVYKEFVRGGKAGAAAPDAAATAVAAVGAEPLPDIKYQDGSVGYSPEQFKKLGDWQTEVAVAKAQTKWQADLDKRVKPFENQRATAEKIAKDNEARIADVRSQIREAEETWGDALPAQGSPQHKEILALLQANPTMKLTTAVGKILLPKLRADKAATRAEVVASMKKAPQSVSKGGGQQTRSGAGDGAAARTTEDVIRDSIRNLPGR